MLEIHLTCEIWGSDSCIAEDKVVLDVMLYCAVSSLTRFLTCLTLHMMTLRSLATSGSGEPVTLCHIPEHLFTNLLTPWCRVLLEKLTGLQLIKKHPAFYGTRRFITALTSVRHLSLSWASPIQPTSHLLEIHPNIIHPSTPRSPQWSLSLRFPHQDTIRPPLLTHTRHMPSPSHSSRFYHPHNIGRGVQSSKFS